MAELEKPAEGEETPRRRKVTKIGVVTSNKMQKTVVVAVESTIAHSEYGRTVRRTRKFMAHDEGGKCAIGDRVEIIESRPLSRRKRWRVQRILGRPQAGA